MLSVHTSPLDQPGTGDAGGMNVYVLELSRALAARGARVEIFTRATSSELPETVVLGGTDAAGAPLSRADRRAVLLADDVPAGVTPPVLCTTCRPDRSSGWTSGTCRGCCAA